LLLLLLLVCFFFFFFFFFFFVVLVLALVLLILLLLAIIVIIIVIVIVIVLVVLVIVVLVVLSSVSCQYHCISPESSPILELPVQVAVAWHPSAANTSTHAYGHELLGLLQVLVQGVGQAGLAQDLSADVEGGVGAMLLERGVGLVLGAREVDVVFTLLVRLRLSSIRGIMDVPPLRWLSTCRAAGRTRGAACAICSCLRASSLFCSTLIISIFSCFLSIFPEDSKSFCSPTSKYG
jgi:hypothetical protein